MPHYKLYYFDFRARAESARILLSLAGADWDDIRTSYVDKTDFETNIKPKCPYGMLPILECDGLVLGQSMAILQYLAKTFGFLPETDLQIAVADGIVDQIQDCFSKYTIMYFEKDPSKKEELKKQVKNLVSRSLKDIEKILKENSGGKTFFFGDKITYADVHFFDYVNSTLNRGILEVPDILKEYPGLTKLYNGVMNEPKILAYLQKRPQSED